jgi:hypothetical protein
VFMLGRYNPGRFRDDRALDFQCVRRVRGLSAVNAGSHWDHKTRRMKRVYRDPSPRSVEVFAGWLRDAYGGAGLQLADLEARTVVDREAAERAERQRLFDAIGELQ